MTNNKLSPVTVYVPTGLHIQPELSGEYFIIRNSVSCPMSTRDIDINNPAFDAATTHWLKEQQGYLFTREELEGLLGKAMDKMENRVDYENNKDGWETVPPSKDEIIQSLF